MDNSGAISGMYALILHMYKVRTSYVHRILMYACVYFGQICSLRWQFTRAPV